MVHKNTCIYCRLCNRSWQENIWVLFGNLFLQISKLFTCVSGQRENSSWTKQIWAVWQTDTCHLGYHSLNYDNEEKRSVFSANIHLIWRKLQVKKTLNDTKRMERAATHQTFVSSCTHNKINDIRWIYWVSMIVFLYSIIPKFGSSFENFWTVCTVIYYTCINRSICNS